jgi:hypothetical protein
MARFLRTNQPSRILLFNSTSPYSEPYSWRPRLDVLDFDSIDEAEASSLETPFEEREVLEVVKSMNRDKAPGPYGFFMAFFQDCWDVIKSDIMGGFPRFPCL